MILCFYEKSLQLLFPDEEALIIFTQKDLDTGAYIRIVGTWQEGMLIYRSNINEYNSRDLDGVFYKLSQSSVPKGISGIVTIGWGILGHLKRANYRTPSRVAFEVETFAGSDGIVAIKVPPMAKFHAAERKTLGRPLSKRSKESSSLDQSHPVTSPAPEDQPEPIPVPQPKVVTPEPHVVQSKVVTPEPIPVPQPKVVTPEPHVVQSKPIPIPAQTPSPTPPPTLPVISPELIVEIPTIQQSSFITETPVIQQNEKPRTANARSVVPSHVIDELKGLQVELNKCLSENPTLFVSIIDGRCLRLEEEIVDFEEF